MSREIKFRQWVGGEFHYWGLGINGRSFDGPASGLRKSNERISNTEHQQFTGLQDKNGVDIYEGDIISHAEYIAKPGADVQWLDDAGAWSIGPDWPFSEFYECGISACEVIGNIHEHPMLLPNKEGEV